MADLCNEIVSKVKDTVEYQKSRTSLKSLKKRLKNLPAPFSFTNTLKRDGFGLLAEIKEKSPSMGRMAPLQPKRVRTAHQEYNNHSIVRAISVLTEEHYFGGSLKLLKEIRNRTRKPLLRKDFIIDEYQIYQSRVFGADIILLMATVIDDPKQFADFHDLAESIGLQAICEVHSEKELEVLPDSAKIIGVNSRKIKNGNFKFSRRLTKYASIDATIDVDLFDLYNQLPDKCLKIAESGISAENIQKILNRWPYHAALVGTSILKSNSPIKVILDRFEKKIRAIESPKDSEASAGQSKKELVHFCNKIYKMIQNA